MRFNKEDERRQSEKTIRLHYTYNVENSNGVSRIYKTGRKRKKKEKRKVKLFKENWIQVQVTKKRTGVVEMITRAFSV